MSPGMNKCNVCQSWISKDEAVKHDCTDYYRRITEKINFIHCIFQELEDLNVNLPMGDYTLVYDILEDIRDDFEISEITEKGGNLGHR